MISMLPEALAVAGGYFAYYWVATALALVLPHIVARVAAAAIVGGAVYAIAERLLEYGVPPTVYWILRLTVYAAVAPALIVLADSILDALALPDFVRTIVIGTAVLGFGVLLIRINGAIASRAGQEALIERAKEKRQRRRDLH